jgi:hypothetical protein
VALKAPTATTSLSYSSAKSSSSAAPSPSRPLASSWKGEPSARGGADVDHCDLAGLGTPEAIVIWFFSTLMSRARPRTSWTPESRRTDSSATRYSSVPTEVDASSGVKAK